MSTSNPKIMCVVEISIRSLQSDGEDSKPSLKASSSLQTAQIFLHLQKSNVMISFSASNCLNQVVLLITLLPFEALEISHLSDSSTKTLLREGETNRGRD